LVKSKVYKKKSDLSFNEETDDRYKQDKKSLLLMVI